MIRMYLLYYFVDLSLVRVRFGIRLDAYNFSLKHVIREIFKETHNSVDECNKAE